MRFLFIVTLSLCAAYLANGAKITNTTAEVPAKTEGETVVCNQYIGGQDAKTHKAIEKLDEKVHNLSKKMDQLIKLIQPSPSPGGPGAGSTCKEIYDKHLSKGNKAYLLSVGPGKIPVYCHMTSVGLGACGGGGWTLVMKIDGSKRTFHFDSKLWSNKVDFNLPGGKTGMDRHETKLPTYWNTAFSKICLAMRVGHQIRSMILSERAHSLYSLIANGNYHATSLGRNTWKTLIGSQASLQKNCNKEGFNAACSSYGSSRARIGFLGNNENDCASCDSRIGFGTGGYADDSNTCGCQGSPQLKTMGYMLVQ